MTIAPWMVVTAQQLKWGWIEKDGDAARHRDYEVLRQLSEGVYAVRNPELVLAEEEMRAAGALVCPKCGSEDTHARPSGDRACLNCGAVWKVTPRQPEMPKP